MHWASDAARAECGRQRRCFQHRLEASNISRIAGVDHIDFAADGAYLMPYEKLINPDVVKYSPLYFPWDRVKTELDKLASLGQAYRGRQGHGGGDDCKRHRRRMKANGAHDCADEHVRRTVKAIERISTTPEITSPFLSFSVNTGCSFCAKAMTAVCTNTNNKKNLIIFLISFNNFRWQNTLIVGNELTKPFI